MRSSSTGRTGDGCGQQGKTLSATRARVFEAGERRSARRSPRYHHLDGPRVGAAGGRRRTSVQWAATAADSARRQEGVGRLVAVAALSRERAAKTPPIKKAGPITSNPVARVFWAEGQPLVENGNDQQRPRSNQRETLRRHLGLLVALLRHHESADRRPLWANRTLSRHR
jgi:hypothetical protein